MPRHADNTAQYNQPDATTGPHAWRTLLTVRPHRSVQVLSLGNNLISDLNLIMYLRPKKALQAVNLVGNPFCQEVEYRPYVLAHLKHLKYLDYRLVDEQAVTAAREQYQDDVQEMEERESQEEAQSAIDEEKQVKVSLHSAANLKGIDTLFDDLMVKPDGEMARLRVLQPFVEPLQVLREQVEGAIEELVTTVLSHHELKTKEREMFDAALNAVRAHLSLTGVASEELPLALAFPRLAHPRVRIACHRRRPRLQQSQRRRSRSTPSCRSARCRVLGKRAPSTLTPCCRRCTRRTRRSMRS